MAIAASRATRKSRSTLAKDDILDAAEVLMAEMGYERTTISAICVRSGLPVGSVYHHFGSKAGVLAAVMERGSHRFFAAMPSPDELTESAEANMRRYWSVSADAITANVAYFYLELDLARYTAGEQEIEAARDRVRQTISKHLGAVIEPCARECGVLDAAGLTARLVAFTVTFTRGAIVEAGRNPTKLRELMGDLYSALRASILQHAR